ncbi:MAG: KOW domain-containing RNA-binding protein [Bacillota bacterium]
MNEVKVGQVVKSLAGRDKGSYMIIFDVLDNNYVSLVDGSQRRMENPKKKKIKHLQLTGRIADGFVKELHSGRSPTNEEVRRTLEKLIPYQENNLPQE